MGVFFYTEYSRAYTPTSNTLLYVPMDTDLLDHSLNNVSVTNTGITQVDDQASITVGYFLPSSNDIGLFFTSPALGSGNFTISRREKATANTTSRGSRFSTVWHSSSWTGLLLGYNWTNLYVGTGASTWNIINGAAAFNVATDNWVHWVITRNGNTRTTYRNNVQFYTGSASGTIGCNTGVIGNYRPGDMNPFMGYLSDFIIENRVWTDTERTNYFNATKVLYNFTESTGGGAQNPGCFLKGTPILMIEGYKNIEDIVEGDIVLSYNENTKELEYNKVVQFIKHPYKGKIIKLNGEIEATFNHPVYTSKDKINREYKQIGDIEIGDYIYTKDGYKEASTKDERDYDGEVYNMTVENNHNYFVYDGVLVHNVVSGG